jgi:hypothetical protein
LTNAWVSAIVTETEAQIKIFFISPPGTVGLPFTFQQISLSWVEDDAEKSETIDWSAECRSPGRSIFPGQKIEVTLKMSSQSLPAEGFRLRLWGSRN